MFGGTNGENDTSKDSRKRVEPRQKQNGQHSSPSYWSDRSVKRILVVKLSPILSESGSSGPNPASAHTDRWSSITSINHRLDLQQIGGCQVRSIT